MPKCPHSSCRRGKTVRVKLKCGIVIVDKFVERTGKFVILENHQLEMSQIKSFSILKRKEHDEKDKQ